MNQQLIKYLIREKHCPEQSMTDMILKITKYDDIYQEFLSWLGRRDYQTPNPVTVEGYSAQNIYDVANFLDGIGVYNFLVDLRDNPIQAKKYLEEGFPQK